jgi:hypothetical protein
MMAKSNHVATFVVGINLLVKVLSLLRLHCYHQWMKALNAHSSNILNFGKLWQNSPARFIQTWIESDPSK